MRHQFLSSLFIPLAVVASGVLGGCEEPVAGGTAVTGAKTELDWNTLDEVYVGSEDRVVYPETVRDLHGQPVGITGYLIPTDAHTSPSQFLLSALSFAECYYCQPTGPGTTVEVRSAQPVQMQTTEQVHIEGRLVLLARRGPYEDGLVYRLDRARATR
ncbi:MAG: hypothetical protein AAGI52_07810 [Bacteroidota bacterium]